MILLCQVFSSHGVKGSVGEFPEKLVQAVEARSGDIGDWKTLYDREKATRTSLEKAHALEIGRLASEAKRNLDSFRQSTQSTQDEQAAAFSPELGIDRSKGNHRVAFRPAFGQSSKGTQRPRKGHCSETPSQHGDCGGGDWTRMLPGRRPPARLPVTSLEGDQDG